MLNVTVDRRTWIRGRSGESMLLSDDGRQCCMGFASLAGGLSKEEIHRKLTVGGAVAHIRSRHGIGTESVCPTDLQRFVDSQTISSEVYDANDNADINDADREKQLTTLGLEAGIAFTFTN